MKLMLNKLENIISNVGDKVKSTAEVKNGFQIKTERGAVVNFYPSTGKVTFQGNKTASEKIEICFQRINSTDDVEQEPDNWESTIKDNKKMAELYNLLSAYDVYEINHFFNIQREKLARDYSSSFLNEEELKAWFIEKFGIWFDIYPNVVGETTKYGKTIRKEADFIIKPKSKLQDVGIEKCFGVEVKFINPVRSFTGKSSKTIFQTLSYAYSDFSWEINGSEIKTDAFLVFTNLSFKSERDKLFETHDRFYRTYWMAMLSVANHANVGELIINNSRTYLNSWYLSFAGGNYCSWNKENGINRSVDAENLVNKNRIGYIK